MQMPRKRTVRTTLNLDANLIAEAKRRFPDMTRTALLEEGLRALIARDAAFKLADLGGSSPNARMPKRFAGQR